MFSLTYNFIIVILYLHQTDSKKDLHGILVICLNVSGAMCICVSVIQLLSIMPAVVRRRETMYAILAAGTATGNAAAMFSLSNCHDTEVYSPLIKQIISALENF